MDIPSGLTDPDPDTRAEAYEELSLEMNDELAAAILALTSGDEPDEIRADAIVALGPVIEECGIEYDEGLELEPVPEFGPRVSRETFTAITEQLRAMYADESQPKLVRRRVFEVLVRDPRPWQRDEIRRWLATSDEDWRLTAVFAMGQMTGLEKELLGVLETAEGLMLEEAVRAAGRIGLTGAGRLIHDLAASKTTGRDLRFEAILALPHVDPDSFDLLDELSSSKDRELAAVAEAALEDFHAFRGGLDDDI
mgnify:CR=1 FL=1